jgi:uncharacterized damage-inducible protein DinB
MDQNPVLDAFKYSFRIAHTEEGWISPLLDVVKATDYDTARWKPAPDVASIWEIVAHTIPYTGGRLCDFTGESPANEEDWPKVDGTQASWEALQTRAISVIERLQATVDAASEIDLSTPKAGKQSPKAERLADIIVHDAYHAGQIVKLQQIRAATKTI